MNTRARIALLVAAAIAVATVSTTILVVGIGRLRAVRLYREALAEIARIESDPLRLAAAIGEAAEHARTRADFRRLLQLAWQLEAQLRWPLVQEIAVSARDRRRTEPEFRLALVYASARTGAIDAARNELSSLTDRDLAGRLRVFVELSDPDRQAAVERLGVLDDEFAQLTAAVLADPTRETLIAFFERSAVPGAALLAAMRAAIDGDRGDAVDLLDRYFQAQSFVRPDELRLMLHLAAWTDNADRVDAAVERAVGRAGVRDTAVLVRADRALRDGRFLEAEQLLREISRVPSEFGIAITLNRSVLARDAEGADRELQLLLELEGAARFDARAAHYLAAAHARRGDTTSAERVLAQAAGVAGIPEVETLTSEMERIWLFHRAVLAPRVAIERIESDAWRLLNRYPEAHQIGAFLARVLVQRRDHTTLRELVDRYPQSTATWVVLSRAWLAVRDDDPAQALEALERPGILLDPLVLRARSALALRYLPLHQAERYVAEFLTYAERRGVDDRHMRAALMHAVQLELFQGEREQARLLVERALQLYPDDDGIYGYAGFVAAGQ